MLATVTLTYNRFEALRRCIDAIRKHGGVDQIIVVDNHSTDNTYSWLAEQDDVLVVRTPKNFGVIARNYGFDLVGRPVEWVAQIDDDVVVRSGGLQVMVDQMRKNPYAIATGQQGGYVGDFSCFQATPGLPPGTRVDMLTGFCWMINRGRLEMQFNIQWSDVRYDRNFGMRWHEETDLQCGLRWATRQQGKLVVCPPVADHNRLAGEIDWDLHNSNLDRVRVKWKAIVSSEKEAARKNSPNNDRR
jgi:glycosyltransferase involved in cell wall biosynthesis